MTFPGNDPLDEVAAASRRYQFSAGLGDIPDTNFGHTVIPKAASQQMGRQYMAMPDFDQSAVPHYAAMREDIGKQFDFMTSPREKGGLGINVNVVAHDPYGTGDTGQVYRQVRHDVEHNRNIDVLSSASTGGHPYFTDDQNNMFRAVHDVFGHLGSGRGVDMHGEEAAYQKHARMFSPMARPAMATETRAQNSALHLTGGFQPQKVGLLSAKFSAPTSLSPLQFGEHYGTLASEAAFENRKQGIA